MVVGAHHHVGDEGEVELLTGGSQPLEEVLAVLVGHEQVARVAAVSGKVMNPCIEVARASRHAPEARQRGRRRSRSNRIRHASETAL